MGRTEGANPEQAEFISILELKQLAAQRPPGDPYREVMLAEPDFIPRADFPGKAETWVILMRLAARQRRDTRAGGRPLGRGY